MIILYHHILVRPPATEEVVPSPGLGEDTSSLVVHLWLRHGGLTKKLPSHRDIQKVTVVHVI
jgi:hypothetical protein